MSYLDKYEQNHDSSTDESRQHEDVWSGCLDLRRVVSGRMTLKSRQKRSRLRVQTQAAWMNDTGGGTRLTSRAEE